MIRRHLAYFCIAIAAFLTVFTALPVRAAGNACIADTRAVKENGYLKVYFRIQDCFTPEMEEAVWSGVPTTFRILLVMEEPGLPLVKSKLLDVVLEHTIKYDHLKNIFRVHLPETSDKIRSTTNIEEAKQWMSTVQELPLIPLWRLQKGQPYKLYIKAELSKVNLPLFFRYIFFFVSLWDFETDWEEITVTY
jgi:hypothetical protein